MKEIKVPAGVRQLAKDWLKTAGLMDEKLVITCCELSHLKTLRWCAKEIQSALKRPVQRARKRAKHASRRKSR